MNLTRAEVAAFYMALKSIAGIPAVASTGGTTTNAPEFGRVCAVNRRALEPIQISTDNALQAITGVNGQQPLNTPMMVAQHQEVLQKHKRGTKAYEKAAAQLTKEHAATIASMEKQAKARKELLAEVVPVEVAMVSASIMPALPTGAIDSLFPMIIW